MKVDYNSVPQSSPPHDLPVRQAAPLLPSPRKRRAGPTQLQLGEERDVDVRPKRARLAGCGSENQFPTVFASPSDLDQEDFPMENLPSPAPVSAPVPEEPRVAALPSPMSAQQNNEDVFLDMEVDYNSIPQFPTVFASPSDLDQEDFPMEDLSLDEENEDHPLPVPVVAPVPEEPRVAALPSPAPVSAPVPEEPRFAALPSPAPVSAPVPEEPRVAALPSPAPVSTPVPEYPRVSALHSPAPVSAPVPEEPWVVALPSPAPVSAPVPVEPRVATLHSPAPVSAPVPEERRVAALPTPAPVSAPVPEEPRAAAIPSPSPVSAPVPVEPRVAALPSPAPVSAPFPEEPRVAALPSPAPVSAPFPEEPRVAALPSPMSAQQNNEDVFEDMEVDYNSIPQSSPPHDLPVRQAAPLLPSPRKRRAAPTQLQLGEERDVDVRPKRARLAGCGSENQ
ncbi:uncharacterized protein [Misgurnus anguillicaudatus]|uniref:uncharacterized protein n=1 Tax=Misgurnus anguillicaudatus TaxID=75329 RepID=UPI003CCF158E